MCEELFVVLPGTTVVVVVYTCSYSPSFCIIPPSRDSGEAKEIHKQINRKTSLCAAVPLMAARVGNGRPTERCNIWGCVGRMHWANQRELRDAHTHTHTHTQKDT